MNLFVFLCDKLIIKLLALNSLFFPVMRVSARRTPCYRGDELAAWLFQFSFSNASDLISFRKEETLFQFLRNCFYYAVLFSKTWDSIFKLHIQKLGIVKQNVVILLLRVLQLLLEALLGASHKNETFTQEPLIQLLLIFQSNCVFLNSNIPRMQQEKLLRISNSK